jgi:DNA-binding MarR family transcriptional regulator
MVKPEKNTTCVDALSLLAFQDFQRKFLEMRMLKRGSPCEEVLKAIRSIIRSVDLQSKVLDQQCGLTGSQLVVLKEIEKSDLITTSQLAKHILISQSTATLILDRLVEKQLVNRTRDTIDKRKWFISLTPKGKEFLKYAPASLQNDFIEHFEQLHDWEQNLTLAALQRVVSMFNTKLADESAPILTNETYPH